VNGFLGGWQVSGTYQFQSGFPLTFGNLYYDGDPKELVSNIGKKVNGQTAGLDFPAWDVSRFYFHDAAVQTNGVDDPSSSARIRGFSSATTSATSPRHCRMSGRTTSISWISASTRTSRSRAT
jgi:hypothetical protein